MSDIAQAEPFSVHPPERHLHCGPGTIAARACLPLCAAPPRSMAADPCLRPPDHPDRRHFGRFLHPRPLAAFDGGVYTSLNWSLAGILLSGYSGRREVGDELGVLIRLCPDRGWYDFRAIVMRRAPERGQIALGFLQYDIGPGRLLEDLARRSAAQVAMNKTPAGPGLLRPLAVGLAQG